MNGINLPSVGETPKPKKRGRPKKQKVENSITAEIPVMKSEAYQTDSVFLRRMTAEQKRCLSLLFRGVNGSGKQLSNNKIVKHPVDAVRWLLEEINKAVPK